MKLLLFLAASLLPLSGQSTIDPALPHAYSANTGWVTFRPSSADGIIVQEHFLAGYAYAANTGWVHFGDGSPINGHTYSNTSHTDFGVNRDGSGNLAGYAYSANAGWIHFGWAITTDPNRPRIDLSSGEFSGFAYSANTGWLNLGTGLLKTSTISYPDSDGDGIADSWEYAHFIHLTIADDDSDSDHDGHSDAEEYEADTSPTDPAEFFRIVSQSLDETLTGNTLVLTTVPSRFYRIETHTLLDGSPWVDSGLGTFAPDPGPETSRFIIFPSGPKTFFRAVAIKPLPP